VLEISCFEFKHNTLKLYEKTLLTSVCPHVLDTLRFAYVINLSWFWLN